MKKTLVMSVMAGLLLASPAWAADPQPAAASAKPAPTATAPAKKSMGAPSTRQEAIARMEARLAELKKMSDEEWNKRAAMRDHRRAGMKHAAPAAGQKKAN